jgi:centrosomal CEP192-like protein
MLLPREACRSALSCVPRLALITLAISLGFTPATAQVTANPSQLNFGDVQIGNKSTLPVVLTNQGSSTVSITKGQIQGSGFLPNTKLPITLNPGQNFTMNVTFTPHADGPYSAILSGSNHSGPVVSIPVTGNGTQSGYSVNLSWDPSQTPPDIVGYNVYRGTQSGGPYSQINSVLDPATAYIDYTVLAGATYYYVTTAVDSSGQQSAYSNQTEAVIP